MNRLHHWHPVALPREVRQQPYPFRLDGHEFVLFRTERGLFGAMPRACAHRRADLALGKVRGEELICGYHGWGFQPTGEIRSPGNPSLTQRADCLEVSERHGALWVRAKNAQTAFPQLDFEGFSPIGVFHHRVAAPLQLVLDNFVEVEHTSFVHALLGYAAADLASVEVAMSTGEDWVRVINQGPQRKLPLPLRSALGIGATDTFVDDWTTYFSPVYSVYDHYWLSPEGARRENTLRTVVFFNPIDEQNCELWSFAGASSRLLEKPLVHHGLRGLLRLSLELEIRLDRRQVESLADKDTSMRGMKLGRFDKVMWETRTRVASIYGLPEGG